MNRRKLFLDEAPGERRGIVTLDGQPERLLIERYDDVAVQQPGAQIAARVRRIERTLNLAFLDLGQGPDAVLPLPGAGPLTEGAWLEVEIAASPRGDKGPVARLLRAGDGPVRLLAPAASLHLRLQTFAPGAVIVAGAAARAAADVAEDVALGIEHPLPGGGRLFIETTQALVAIDVDLASASGDPRKAVARVNREAIAAAARLLRLKGLGGLLVIDLVGKGHDGAALSEIARTAFQPDGAGVSVGPISRFGLFELSLPRTATPVAERLLDADGRPSTATTALRMLRVIEQAAGPGRQVHAVCAPAVADIAAMLAPQLTDRIGPRFVIIPDAGPAPDYFEVHER